MRQEKAPKCGPVPTNRGQAEKGRRVTHRHLHAAPDPSASGWEDHRRCNHPSRPSPVISCLSRPPSRFHRTRPVDAKSFTTACAFPARGRTGAIRRLFVRVVLLVFVGTVVVGVVECVVFGGGICRLFVLLVLFPSLARDVLFREREARGVQASNRGRTRESGTPHRLSSWR